MTDVCRGLDSAYDAWERQLTAAERRAIRRYQSKDRHYRTVNDLLRGEISQEELPDLDASIAAYVATHLRGAIERGRVPSDTVVFRGVRSLQAVFGVERENLPEIIGRRLVQQGFVSCSLDRAVAETEFSDREHGALIVLSVPRGSRAAWLGRAGRSDTEYQRELVLPHGTPILVTRVWLEQGLVVIEARVEGDELGRRSEVQGS